MIRHLFSCVQLNEYIVLNSNYSLVYLHRKEVLHMNSLICPVSKDRVNKNIIRMTGFMVALTVVLYVITKQPLIIGFLALDFIIRAFSIFKFSPISLIACGINIAFKVKPKLTDKAPKLFAARVGVLFTSVSFLLYFVSIPASLIVASILVVFALMESLFDFCVGCVVYTYVVLPIHKKNLVKNI